MCACLARVCTCIGRAAGGARSRSSPREPTFATLASLNPITYLHLPIYLDGPPAIGATNIPPMYTLQLRREVNPDSCCSETEIARKLFGEQGIRPLVSSSCQRRNSAPNSTFNQFNFQFNNRFSIEFSINFKIQHSIQHSINAITAATTASHY